MILDHTSGERHCLLSTIAEDYRLNDNPITFGVLRTGDLLCVIAEYDDPTLGDPGSLLQCTYNDTVYNFTVLSDWNALVCQIPYRYNRLGRVTVNVKDSADQLQSGNTKVSSINLDFSIFATVPSVSITPELYADCTNVFTVTQGPLDSGYFGAVYALNLYLRAPGETEFQTIALLSKSTAMQCSYVTENIVGYEWYMLLNYRTYDEDSWKNSYNNYASVAKIVTPVQTVTRSKSYPNVPSSLHTGMLLAGNRVSVSWEAVEDELIPIVSYTLERSVDGGDFVTLYTGTSLQYPDTVPAAGNSIQYRLCTNSTGGISSRWYTTDILPVIKSNMYIGTAEGIRIVTGVQIGGHRVSPFAVLG